MTRRTTPLLPETAVVTEAAQAELSPQGARPRKATALKAAAPKGAAPKGAAGAGAKSPAAKVEPARTPRRTAKPATESPGTLVTGEPSPAASKPQAAPKPRAAAKAVAAAGPARKAAKAAKAGVKPESAAPTVAAPVQPIVASTPAPASPAKPAPPRVKEPPAPETPPGPINFEAFAGNLARLVEEGGKAMAAYLRPREEGRVKDDMAEEMADVMKTLGNVAEYWLADPQRAVEAQSRLVGGYLSLWSSTLKRLSGENVAPVAEPPTRDGRFADPEWSSNPFFDALKQTYLLTANWAEKLVDDAEIDTHTRHKAEFYVRQIAGAVSPSNFVLTNPELLRATFSSNGENLVRGMKMLAEDIEAGGGELKIRQTDTSKFQVGTNLAITPGKVIFQNELMQLIQYSPTTETVLKTPVVIVPPWINKFYILDLNPEKSFVRWAVAQGLTVFIVSWVNPDSSLAEKGFEEYMRDGVLKAVEVAKAAAGTEQVHTVGYCVGGTMLAMTLAWLTAGKGADKARAGKARRKAAGKASNAGAEMSDGIAAAGIASATFFTTQVDFKLAGDLKVFIDEEQVALLERRMLESGLMDGRVMANAFNMLRANDLIWPYVVNNYLKGQAPFPFDILYWNSDPTRMPRANHSFYLRNCYLDNKFARGELELAGERLDLSRVKLPIYSLATREDHIAPAVSVFRGLKFFGTRPRFVLAGSGHIAGVVNPPSRAKYQYWVGTEPGRDDDLESWIAAAQMHPGSWWPDWFAWLEDMDGARVPAREPGGGVFEPIEDAPGSYVKVKV